MMGMSHFEIMQLAITLGGWIFMAGMVWAQLRGLNKSVDELKTLFNRVNSLESRAAATEQRCEDRKDILDRLQAGAKRASMWLMLAAGLLSSCSEWAPRSELRATSWQNGTTHTQVIDIAQGWPEMWGEHRRVVATPGMYAADEVDKKTMGTFGGMVVGGAVGVLTGSPAVMTALGTLGGAVSQAMDKRTTDTLPAVPWMAVKR